MMDSMIDYVPQSHLQFQMTPWYKDWVLPQPSQNLNPSFSRSMDSRSNREGKRYNFKGRMQVHKSLNGNLNDCNPSLVNNLQYRGVLKPRKVCLKFTNRRHDKNMKNVGKNSKVAPFAPRNTTSFIMRCKRRSGITPFVTPSPQTPAVFATPIFSPLPDSLMNKAEEEWGVNCYGSMNGLIRLKSSRDEAVYTQEHDAIETESSESDVEQHAEMERRIDLGVSRFEIIMNPKPANAAELQEENLILKERLLMVKREMEELKEKINFHMEGVKYQQMST